MAIWAVSRSRISPTRMTSGSCRRMARRAVGEGQVDFVVDRALHDAVDFVFDGVFGGDDLGVDVVEFGKGRVERRRLAGPGRPGDEHDAVGLLDDLAELGEHVGPGMPMRSSERPTFERSRIRMTTLSPNIVGSTLTRMSTRFPPTFSSIRPSCGIRRSAMSRFDMTLIRLAIAVGKVPGRRDHFVQHAVAAVPHLVFFFERLEVDVRGVVPDSHQQDHVDQLADRGGVRHFRQVVEVDARFPPAVLGEIRVALELLR